MSLFLTIFVLTFMTQLISWVGQSVLLERAYEWYLWVTRSDLAKQQRELKKDLLTKKAELLRLSAKDHFAKYMKLKRSVDKGLTDLEKLNGEIASSRTAFSVKFNSVIWVGTTGVQFVVGWWYRKAAVFYLPPGWFGPLTWWLAFPFGPKGSVSVGVWQMACKRVLVVCERIAKDFAGSYWQTSEEESTTAKT
ncbi:WRB/Get1 family [Amanita rubescens]|nr:WRB/Get1 family [Amanita rubescens]